MSEEQLRIDALDYHEFPTPGKISIAPTKALANQRDLSLAYSPGVAYACTAIQENPELAARYTARANLVAVITNGTAVLGLGNIGALAGKPVMEGKGCLFKKFAGIDVFDIEINEMDPDKIVEVVAALEPTFGGINLEDIKAPECFYIERKLRERMKIPVFHDDQHGTAIVAAAAVLNGLKIVGKDIGKVKLVCSGAGAAALACLNLQVSLGLDRGNIFVTDSKGVVYKGRKEAMDPDKERYAQDTKARTLDDIIGGADIFLGLSAGGVLTAEMVKKMADKPIILAMANPEPEIRPELAKKARPDCLIGTGRSDYPNQVNNSLCFPFIFRGALDCGASHDQRGDEARGGARPGRTRPRRAVRNRCAGIRRADAAIRPGLPDSARLRSAPHHQSGPGGGESGDGERRREPADQGFRRVSRSVDAVCLPVRNADGAGVRGGQARTEARRVCRRRGRTRAARGTGRGG